jgi:hypothetical protein
MLNIDEMSAKEIRELLHKVYILMNWSLDTE